MNVITIDLELNQPSRKIIQLGYAINNSKNGKLIMSQSWYVDPKEPIDSFITGLTGIKDRDVIGAGNLYHAYSNMVDDITKHQTAKFPLQWGLDHYELRTELDIPWDEYVFARRAIDVKALYQAYAMARPQGKTVAGLSKALSVLGLEFIGSPHDAMDDAVNTFRAFKALTDKMVKYDEITKAVKRG